MRSFLNIVKDELALIIEDKSILLTCLLAPIFYAFFVGSIYKEKDVANIPIAIVDHDHSSLSRKVGRLVDSNQKIQVQDIAAFKLLAGQVLIASFFLSFLM